MVLSETEPTSKALVPWAARSTALDSMLAATRALQGAASSAVSTLFEPNARRRRKLIAMAKECASKLRLGDWDVVMWDPESISLKMLGIIAASPELDTPEAKLEAAWQLSGATIAENPIEKFVDELMADDVPEEKRGIAFEYLVDKEAPIIYELEKLGVPGFAHIPVELHCSSINQLFLLLLMLMVDHMPGVFEDAIRRRFFTDLPRYPLHSFREMNFLVWSETQLQDYEHEWNAAYEIMRKLAVKRRRPVGQVLDSSWVDPHVYYRFSRFDIVVPHGTYDESRPYREIAALCLDFIAVTSILRCNTLNFDSLALHEIDSYGRSFITTFLIQQYASFISRRIALGGKVGPGTNMTYLREKHCFNNRESSADESAWNMFKSSAFVQADACESFKKRDNIRSFDYFQMMNSVLGGESRRVSHLQASIKDITIDRPSLSKNTFLGGLNRRKVSLFLCGKDRALVIPYLNKIVLHLNDKNWVRAHDVKALQPFKGDYNCGAVRRAANILLAMEYPKAGHPVVNEDAAQLIHEYAEKGKLFSRDLRVHVRSVMFLSDRVDIDKLAISARQVFENDEIMSGALVRELIHDRLHMNSDNSPLRFKVNYQPIENDAYFDMCYLRRDFPVRNNVGWGSGVPMHGLSFTKRGRKGILGGRHHMEVGLVNASGGFELTLWIPESFGGSKHSDLQSCYIEDPNHRIREICDASVVRVEALDHSARFCSKLKYNLGQYCQVSQGDDTNFPKKHGQQWSSSCEVQSKPRLATPHSEARKEIRAINSKSVVTAHVLEQSMTRSYAASAVFGEQLLFSICKRLSRVICPHDPRDLELFREELRKRGGFSNQYQLDYMTAAEETVVFALSFKGEGYIHDIQNGRHGLPLDKEWDMLGSFMSHLSRAGVERVRFWMDDYSNHFIPFSIWPTVILYSDPNIESYVRMYTIESESYRQMNSTTDSRSSNRYFGWERWMQKRVALWGAGLFEPDEVEKFHWRYSSRAELLPQMALQLMMLNVFHGTDYENDIAFGKPYLFDMAQGNVLHAVSNVEVGDDWKQRLSLTEFKGRSVVDNILLQDGKKTGQFLDRSKRVVHKKKWNGVEEFLSGNHLKGQPMNEEFKEAFKNFEWYNFITIAAQEYQLLRLYDTSPSNVNKSLWLLVKMHGRSLNFKYGRAEWTKIVCGWTSPLLRGAIENKNMAMINSMLEDQLGRSSPVLFETWTKVDETQKPEWT